MPEANSLTEVRANIDRIDEQIVQLLAERGGYVRQAAAFKTSVENVNDQVRVEQIIERVRGLAEELGAEPDIVEQVYRTMISGFIEHERRIYQGEA